MRISVHDLTVRYGRRPALDGVSFEVAPGSVWALLGRNGAGKSSLVKVLLGHRPADSGAAAIDGLDPWRHRARLMRTVTATPETPDAPAHLRVRDLERYSAPLYPTWDAAGFAGRLERFDIPPRQKFGTLSRGQKGLVMLALALAPRPELLVLDDPTLGLDPVARRFVFDELIGELADRKVTVFLTSHDLEGVERVATHVGILKDGRLVAEGELESLRAEAVAAGVETPNLEEIFVARTGGGRARDESLRRPAAPRAGLAPDAAGRVAGNGPPGHGLPAPRQPQRRPPGGDPRRRRGRRRPGLDGSARHRPGRDLPRPRPGRAPPRLRLPPPSPRYRHLVRPPARRLPDDPRSPASPCSAPACSPVSTSGARSRAWTSSPPAGLGSGDLPTLLSMGVVLPMVFILGLLLLAKNVGGLALFGDRRWSALDLASVIVLAIGLVLGFGKLYHWNAPGAGPSLVHLAATVLLFGLLMATWLQVWKGRSEPDRAHRFASLALLATACCAGGSALIHARWIVEPDWSRLEARDASYRFLDDRIIAVEADNGLLERPAFRFLLDPRSGRTTALGPCISEWPGCRPLSSLNRRVLVWLEQPGTLKGALPPQLMKLALGSRGELPAPSIGLASPSPIVWSRRPASWDLSPDGTRVVSRLWQGRLGTVVVVESLDSGRVLLSRRFPDCDQPGAIFFADPHRVALNCRNPSWRETERAWTVERFDIDAGPGSAPETVRLTNSIFRHRYGAISGGDAAAPVTLLPRETTLSGPHLGEESSDGWTVAQLWTGEIVAHLEIPSGFTVDDAPVSGAFFSDRRFAGAVGSESRRALAVWDPQGRLLRELAFPKARSMRVFGPADDQRRVLVTWAPRAPAHDVAPPWKAVSIDVTTGEITTLANDLRLLSWSSVTERSVVVESRRSGEPLWFDPATTTLRPIRGAEGTGRESPALGR